MRTTTTHVYVKDPSGGPDHRGAYRCRCGLPEDNEHHDLPDMAAEMDEHRRRAGETKED